MLHILGMKQIFISPTMQIVVAVKLSWAVGFMTKTAS